MYFSCEDEMTYGFVACPDLFILFIMMLTCLELVAFRVYKIKGQKSRVRSEWHLLKL